MKTLSILFCCVFIFAACQQETNDDADSTILPISQRINITSVNIHGDVSPFTRDNWDGMAKIDETTYQTTKSLSAGVTYSLYFSLNNDTRNLLVWSGKENSLEFYNPLSPFHIIPKQRARKIIFSVAVGGNYQFTLNTQTMSISITGLNTVTYQLAINSASFISSRYTSANNGWDPLFLDNKMQSVLQNQFIYSLSNLIPGRELAFRFVLNNNTNNELGKDPDNPFTAGNNFLDAVLFYQTPSASDYNNVSVRKVATSEQATITLNTITRAYTINMNPSPAHADGYYDSSFYGTHVLSNTNTGGALEAVYTKDLGSAWYFGIKGTLTNGRGVPAGHNTKFVIFINNTLDNTGRTGDMSLYHPKSKVNVPGGASVEYMLIIDASYPTAPTSDGVNATRWGARLFGPLTSTSSNYLQYPIHQLSAYTPTSNNGFFQYGDIYEVLIPKFNADGSPFFNVKNIAICAISWSTWTNFGGSALSNTNHPAPIAESLPGVNNYTNLPAPANWVSVP